MNCNSHIVILLRIINKFQLIRKTLPKAFGRVIKEPFKMLEHVQVNQVFPLLLCNFYPFFTIKFLFKKIFRTLLLNFPKLQHLHFIEYFLIFFAFLKDFLFLNLVSLFQVHILDTMYHLGVNLVLLSYFLIFFFIIILI